MVNAHLLGNLRTLSQDEIKTEITKHEQAIHVARLDIAERLEAIKSLNKFLD